MKKGVACLLLAFFSNFSYSQTCIDSRSQDSTTLIKIYLDLASKGTIDHWNFSNRLELIDPLRIQLSPDGCHIQFLNFADTDIHFDQDRIPNDFSRFSELADLNLSQCNITGTIPKSLYQLNKLKNLNLSYNQLTGNLDADLKYLSQLEVLSLSENKLEGELIPELFTLKNLKEISLRHNLLKGILPESIGDLTNLEILRLGQNQFSGSLPASITKLSNLTQLSIQENHFEGKVPEGLNQLSLLNVIYLNDNLFDEIPSFSNVYYNYLNISNNHLTFEDVIKVKDNKINATGKLIYSPQLDIVLGLRKELNPGESHLMEIPFDKTILGNKHLWFLNDVIVVSKERSRYIQSFNKKVHGGIYTVEIRNDEVPNLSLHVLSDTLTCAPQIANYHLIMCENEHIDLFGVRFDKNHPKDKLVLSDYSVGGCDSIIYVDIQFNATSTSHFYVTTCEGTPYEWNNQLYFNSGVFKQVFNNAIACDSTVYMHLDIRNMQDNAIVNSGSSHELGSIELNVTNGSPPYTYKWNYKNLTTPKIDQLSSGTYVVTVTDDNHCQKIFSYYLNVSSVGNEADHNTFKIAPNPVSSQGQLTIELPKTFNEIGLQVELISTASHLVPCQWIFDNNEHTISTTLSCKPGIYFLNIKSVQQQLNIIRKVVVID